MRVALCCIGRLENQYAVEYVEHYKKLGFDKIFIYDNNHDGEEHFEEVLQPFIDDGFVTIIDYRNKEAVQLSAYNDCYLKYGKEYDWIAFFDFDEFLTLVEDKDIKSYLSNFENFDCVKINWMVYTDNDLVLNDHRPLHERFTTPMDYDKPVGYSFPENNHTKSIIKGGIENFKWRGNPHVPGMSIKYSDSLGNQSESSAFQPYNFTKAYIKHFTTKTIDEWINNKKVRGVADRIHKAFNISYSVDNFFKINNKTDEKIKYINKTEKKSNVGIFICTHKDFKKEVTNECYEIVDIRKNKIKEHNHLDDKFYSELLSFYNVSKYPNLPKYVGFCHYRRYFDFLDDIPDMDEIFKKYDTIVIKPLILSKTVREQYALFHNIEDLEIIEKIIKEKYPEHIKGFENYLNGNIFIPYNMFIMKREDFKEYVKFVFEILDEYLKIVGTDIRKRIEDNKDKYLKDFSPNNSADYQYRIGGYLGERLTNLFYMIYFKTMKTCKVVITENKYNLKNNNI